MYSTFFGGTSFDLLPGTFYEVSWDDSDQDIAWMDVNDIANFFVNYYNLCPRCWRVGQGNWWTSVLLPNTIHIKVKDTTNIRIRLQDKEDNVMSELFEVRKITIRSLGFIPEGSYIDLENMKYYWHKSPD